MLTRLPKSVIAPVPENVRFYNFMNGERQYVIQIDISRSIYQGVNELKPGDIVISSEKFGVILGWFMHPIGSPDPLVAFYSEIDDAIRYFRPRERGECFSIIDFDISEFKKVGHINL
ncbi:MAG: hypothetical protein WAV31_02610 [Candidatus Moraniibacteriota bacterium]